MDENVPDHLDIALGLAVRLRRHKQGISQSELGEAIGVSFQQIQKYERGTNRISFSTLARICQALRCTIPELVADVEQLEGVTAPHETLVQPEAAPLLEALSEIRSPVLRSALLDFVRALAKR